MTSWDQKKGGQYLGYGGHHEYELVTGTFALPVAVAEDDLEDGESPVVVVQAHCPYRKRVLAFDAKKTGSPAVLPSPESTGAFTFIGGSIVFDQPSFDGSMTSFVWHGQGVYEYVETVRSRVSDGFLLMSFPFKTAAQSDTLSQGQSLPQGQTAAQPQGGAVAQAGSYAQAGYSQAPISLSSGGYAYNVPCYWPGAFFNAELANGGSPA